MSSIWELYVGGQMWQGEEARPVLNPWDGSEVARVFWAGAKQLEESLQAAHEAAPLMRRASRAERSGWCESIAAGLEARLEEFAQLMRSESGKPIKLARDEVRRAISTFRLASQEALRFGGEMVPLDGTAAGKGYLGATQRYGSGPVAAITPFNFPLNLVAHKVAPALAVGNPVLLKPAPATPLTSLLLGELVVACGIPLGGFSCLNLDNDLIERLCADPRVPVVSFTGSARVGWNLKRNLPHKKVVLELGGNATAIVHSDANLEHAASRLAAGGYAYAGQVCISVQHILVHREVEARFLELYTAAVRALGVGDPADEATMVGPVIRPAELERLQSWVDEATDLGGRLLLGGKAEAPSFQPTVLTAVPPRARLAREEVFGPVTTVDAYDEFDEAVARVNRSPYGLQASVFTRDLERVMASWDDLQVGAVIVNDYPTFRVDSMPYGGVKESGFGREGVVYSMEEMSEPRLLVINRNPLQA